MRAGKDFLIKSDHSVNQLGSIFCFRNILFIQLHVNTRLHQYMRIARYEKYKHLPFLMTHCTTPVRISKPPLIDHCVILTLYTTKKKRESSCQKKGGIVYYILEDQTHGMETSRST